VSNEACAELRSPEKTRKASKWWKDNERSEANHVLRGVTDASQLMLSTIAQIGKFGSLNLTLMMVTQNILASFEDTIEGPSANSSLLAICAEMVLNSKHRLSTRLSTVLWSKIYFTHRMSASCYGCRLHPTTPLTIIAESGSKSHSSGVFVAHAVENIAWVGFVEVTCP